jgi:hypothetical protein
LTKFEALVLEAVSLSATDVKPYVRATKVRQYVIDSTTSTDSSQIPKLVKASLASLVSTELLRAKGASYAQPKQAGESFRPASAADWRAWLDRNGQTKTEVWCLVPHKIAGESSISYTEAVEEALCFGWIDGLCKAYGDAAAHRFTPRRPNSSWSEVNKHHARLLIEAGKMTPTGFAVLPDLSTNAREYAPDIVEALQRDSVVWSNFAAFPDYYRDIRIAAIENLRGNPEMFRQKLDHFIEKTRKNQRFGRFR